MVKKNMITTAQVLDKVKDVAAPLPSQSQYMRDLAGILAIHMNRNLLIEEGYAPDDLPAPSAVVVAPTGQGKTFLLRKMVTALNLNLITVDCSTLVGESYKGVSLSQRIAGAMEEAKDQKTFSQSILFFDEVDKLAGNGTSYSSGMTSILQLFNGGSVSISKDDRTAKSIDVSRFTILMGGAFVGLEEIIRQRVCPRAKIGFDAQTEESRSDGELMQMVTMMDLVRYGLMQELLGRVGTILVIPSLKREDYRQLLTADTGSIRMKYERYFRELYNVRFEITEAGMNCLTEKSMDSSSGARSVIPLVNDLMRKALPEVESDDQINSVLLDSDGENCFIRYEYGGRISPETPPEPQSTEQQWYTLKAKNTDVLIRKLCRYYRNTGGDANMLMQLEAFLGCAIPHLYHGCMETDFVFASLEKLANITDRERGQDGFDRLMRQSFYVSKEAWSNYDRVYTPWMCRNVKSALECVRVYLQCRHGADEIRFSIDKQKS